MKLGIETNLKQNRTKLKEYINGKVTVDWAALPLGPAVFVLPLLSFDLIFSTTYLSFLSSSSGGMPPMRAATLTGVFAGAGVDSCLPLVVAGAAAAAVSASDSTLCHLTVRGERGVRYAEPLP